MSRKLATLIMLEKVADGLRVEQEILEYESIDSIVEHILETGKHSKHLAKVQWHINEDNPCVLLSNPGSPWDHGQFVYAFVFNTKLQAVAALHYITEKTS